VVSVFFFATYGKFPLSTDSPNPFNLHTSKTILVLFRIVFWTTLERVDINQKSLILLRFA
jgi:hypothetical protein